MVTAGRRMKMDEYIERESILREIERRERLMVGDKTISVDALKRFILNRPAADVAPVVHGRWIEPTRLYYGAKQYECSLCYSDTFWKKHSITEKYPCCPNCGAKMDGGDSDEAD